MILKQLMNFQQALDIFYSAFKMKKLLFITLIFGTVQLMQAQFRYTITSLPDSAEVRLNGELKGYTPYRLNFYWRNAENGKLVVSVDKEGYESWSDTIVEKPLDWDFRKRVYLGPSFPYLNIENSPLIAFDKLVVEFPNGKEVGKSLSLNGEVEQIKWEGSIKIGDEEFAEKFYEVATDMGLNTPISENAKLFSEDQRSRTRLPRYLIGVEITDYAINREQVKGKDYGDGDVKSSTKIDFTWKVLDKKTGKVVLSVDNQSKVTFRQELYQSVENNSLVFEKALIDFLKNEKFISLLKDGVGDEPFTEEESKDVTEVQEIAIPDFASNSEMIKHANPACVTVITDGGHGSGVVIDQKGYVLSAYHVVEGVNKIDVKFSSGLTLQAEIVSYDKFHDLVLLDIAGEGFKPLPLKWEMNKLSLGEDVLTIGTPAELELGQSISKGIVSGNRKHEGNVYVQLDMAVSPGNSGGPLLNSKGEIVGVVQRKLVGKGIEGIGFAIPISQVIETLNLKQSQ